VIIYNKQDIPDHLQQFFVPAEIGLEATPDEYVAELVGVFREVRRVLRDDGTLWLNLGDSYASSPPGNTTVGVSAKSGLNGVNGASGQYRETLAAGHQTKRDTSKLPGLKPKDLIGIPWMVAFALRSDGWYLRSDIIWSKPNPMPESVKDRPTKAHEYVFLLSKGPRYYYDADAIREPHAPDSLARVERGRSDDHKWADGGPGNQSIAKDLAKACHPDGRNRRSVWTVTTQPFAEAHFATMPPALAEPCILAGAPVDGVVLDPFGGAGTTALVARRNGRRFVHVELNPEYMEIAKRRVDGETYQAPMFGGAA
jgi:DNA modification methylase